MLRSDTLGGTVLALTHGPESDTENLSQKPPNDTISEVSSDALDSGPDHLDLLNLPSAADNATRLARGPTSAHSNSPQRVLSDLKL